MKPVAVSMFSGCGGFCEGVRSAGFDIIAAVEIDRFASQTYRANFPETPLFEGDAHDFLNLEAPAWDAVKSDFESVNDAQVDLLFGGPPCQGFSQIGPRILDDPRNQLYWQFVRVLKQLRPRMFLMENVPNMLLIAKGRFKAEVLEAFAAAGYSRCAVKLVTASDYGVPQVRKRAIFFGVRDEDEYVEDVEDLFHTTLAAQETETVTVSDALSDLPEMTAAGYETLPYPRSRRQSKYLDEVRLDRSGIIFSQVDKLRQSRIKVQRLHNHHTKEIQARRKALIALLAPGKKGDSLPREVWNGLRPEKWRRLPLDRPAYTLLAQMHRDLSEWVHPRFERWITVREAARLQSFHDGFVFQSSEWQMLKQIGNAVPPMLARVLALSALAVLNTREKPASATEAPLLEETPEDLELVAS